MEQDELYHYGMPRRSGRYPFGSGEDPYQHAMDFIGRIDELKKKGMSETEIAGHFKLTTTQLRIQRSLAKDERRMEQVATAKALREKGYSLNEVARQMGFENDSSVRSLLNDRAETNMNSAYATASLLKKHVDEKGMIDIGAGVERELNISKEKLNQAVYLLEMEGYPNYGGGVAQVTNAGRQTNLKVLCPPGTEHKEIYSLDIHQIGDYTSHDDGRTFDTFQYPSSVDSSRINIVYGDKGGTAKDGVIELRRGAPDLSLGKSNYAQVRIMVDNKSYLKGMAVYADDLPDGCDIRFNTNKKSGTPIDKVLKPIKDDPSNPFGSLIKSNGQSYYTDPKTGKKTLSAINKRADEGDWTEWADKLPSQFLAKQNIDLVKQQLGIAKESKLKEYDEICSLTNPTVKKALLKTFSDDCDSAAVHLHAAALPRQKYQVILPIKDIKDNEVYAPNFKNGEQIALVRFPHGGTFEIPILTVNNKNKEGQRLMGKNPLDAIGINSKNAERLSGADFDGDTTLCIPCGGTNTRIKSTKPLEGLEGFDTRAAYGPDTYGSQKVRLMTKKGTQGEMGRVSNLITDMTVKGATTDELARAVRHSMVVIDAEKHKLNYKQSEIDNDIKSLKNKYQGHITDNGKFSTGASTLLSQAKGEISVDKRKGAAHIDSTTGEQWWNKSGETYVDKKGNTIVRQQKSTKMFEAKDANSLSSGTEVEKAYADYANSMKSLGNTARKELISTPNLKYSKDANKQYSLEVKQLNASINVCEKNAPKERQAQIIANSVVNAKKKAYPDMDKSEIKKVSQQALTEARNQVGAHRETIKITDQQWDAIQKGAISDSMLQKVMKYADMDVLREKAMPKQSTEMSVGKISRLNNMVSSGLTNAQIAEALGVSTSTVIKYRKGE